MEEEDAPNELVEDHGVLLYYKYVNIPDTDALVDWFQNNCTFLGLLGRVRVAPEGINVTVGGKMSSLEKHITAVESIPLFKGCDFKLASCHRPLDQRIAKECGFTSLSVRAVKEVVTLHSHPSVTSPSISNAGKHLSATEFHSVLQTTGGKSLEDSNLDGLDLDTSLEPLALQSECEFGDDQHNGKVVLLDARNTYETRIGKFLPPKGIQTLEPNIRQYSDLPAWIDTHADELRGNHILMYCTGGVRCEMASAYIRMKGSGYENVYQLSGGVQRYLEAYPDGGFFKGKNFVFDHRISVGSLDKEVIGSCLLCRNPFDDYTSRCRCSNCRMLVLVCNQCQASSMLNKKSPAYICELCHKNDHKDDLSKHPEEGNNNSNDRLSTTNDDHAAVVEHDSTRPIDETEQNVEQYRPHAFSRGAMDCTVEKVLLTKKLKILCLHGFRQNASNLKGRLASFTRKLKHLAEFVFVDAPHELPFIYQSISNRVQDGKDDASLESCTNSMNLSQTKPMLPQNCNRKRAWLIAPNCHRSNFDGCHTDMILNLEGNSSMSKTLQQSSQQDESKLEKANWIQATSPFDPLQYQQQTVGWHETLIHLQEVFSNMGPFDGVLGFSQGASVAATLCSLRQRSSGHNTNINFRFVILCSGFPSPAEEFQQFISNSSMLPIDIPSLHIFGGTAGLDKQIMSDASMQLASFFRSDCCVVLKHSSGHIIPTQSSYIDRIKDFLQFL